ncbi:hypothetical protein C8Q75DRAFT_871232 [Abortiporus biennis]|nr:hypothetical protein C8Q75DRAFT_871232 [Abortiporus biennis]
MCSGATWKREVVPDHKFDFIDTREFTDNSFGMRMKYMFLYVIILKDFLVYISDIFTAVTMLSTDSWSNAIFNSCPPDQANGCVYIPFKIGRWLFFGCIIFSLLLLAYEARKAKKIIASRDISYAFTNVMANNYYSLRSYDHFCFFKHIADSTKRMDDFAFFVFFTFKSWKKLLLADGPRQSINALTLYAFYLSRKDDGDWWDIGKYFAGNDFVTTALTISTAFTVLVFAGSLLLLIIAGICYIPLLAHIQGNLKEYCCHKVDKRISEIIKRRNKQRLAKAAALAKKEAAGDFSHLKNKKGELIAKPMPQPTLPNISLDDEEDKMSTRTRGGPPSAYPLHNDYYYANDRKDYPAGDYPPMPAYNQPYSNYPSAYHQYNPSANTLPEEHMAYDDDYGSTAHLNLSAAPFANAPSASSLNSAYAYSPQDRAVSPYQNASPPPPAHPTKQEEAFADSEIAYGEASPAYTAHPTQHDAYPQGNPMQQDPYSHGQLQQDVYAHGQSGSQDPYGQQSHPYPTASHDAYGNPPPHPSASHDAYGHNPQGRADEYDYGHAM